MNIENVDDSRTIKSDDNFDDDEVIDIIIDDSDCLKQSESSDDTIKYNTVNTINIVNCSDEIIMVTNLFGPSESLVLGTIESPSISTPPPYVQVNASLRGAIDSNIHYQKLIEKGIIKEVSLKTLNKFADRYEKLMDEKYNKIRDEDSGDDLINMKTVDSVEDGIDDSIPIMSSDGNRGNISVIDVDSQSIITPDEGVEKDILNDLGVSEEDLNRFYKK